MVAPMPPLRFARVDSPIGPRLVAETDHGVAAAASADELVGFLAELRRRFPGAEPEPGDLDGRWVLEALGGGALPSVDLRGLPPFDARVYEVVRTIPPGETLTYGEVAALIGSAGAARAVGGAMARCPLFPAVPCHRVVRASDGWSGWGGDDRLKRRLLEAEAHRASAPPRHRASVVTDAAPGRSCPRPHTHWDRCRRIEALARYRCGARAQWRDQLRHFAG